MSCLLLWSLFGYSSILNYADDTVIAGKITNIMDHKYIAQVKKFVEWGKVNYLTLNVKKTKEMMVDFRTNNLYVLDFITIDNGVESFIINDY